MNHRQGSTITTLSGITQFLDAHPEFAPLKDSTARKNIETSLSALDTLGADQYGSSVMSQQETAAQRDLRLALRQHHMQAIAYAAKKAKLSGPDLTALQMPKNRPSLRLLIAAAQGMAQAAQANAPALIDAGLPADFVARLQAATIALESAIAGKSEHASRRTTATAGLKAAERDATTAIKVLDTQVQMLCGKNAALLAGWKAVKRIAPKPGLPRGAAPATPSPA